MTDLPAIRARCEAATPGPWTAVDSGDTGWDVRSAPNVHTSSFMTEGDAAFIAHARTDIPALLSALDAAAARIAELEAALEPFAKAALHFTKNADTLIVLTTPSKEFPNYYLTVRDLRGAYTAAALPADDATGR